jgi:signal transduction histidine kinase
VTIGSLDGGFYVEDDGPGFPTDDVDQVLEAGYSTASESIGLGLSIVRRIAEAHGWSLSLVEGDAGGARFEFTGVDVVP